MEFKGLSILVVDDEEALREIFCEEFTSLGAKVESAENGRKAFALLQEKKFDILFSDVRMPGGDGIELIKNIHSKLEVKPKIFLCTGFADLTKEEAAKFGVIEIFPKPLSLVKIVERIKAS